jgi:hypothetical protein
MATRKTDTDTVMEEIMLPIADPLILTPEQSKSVLAAWKGIYHFFGGRVQNWAVTPEGVIAEGFTVKDGYDPEQIITDISKRDRRVELFPAILWINGNPPDDFANSQEMTNFMVQYFRGSVEEGTAKAPAYVRSAVAGYKGTLGVKTRRGPKRKVFRLDNLSELDETVLKDVNSDELERLQALIKNTLSSK